MSTSTVVKVARYHLVDRFSYTAFPWLILVFDFAVLLTITASMPPAPGHFSSSGALGAIFIFFFFLGVLSMIRSLPFAFAIGVSRRCYYAGTVLLAVVLGAVYGLALAVLQVIERATDGWGLGMHFFQVAYILDGPWYLTWLTSFTGLALLFVYGMWFGLVYRRWNIIGVSAFGAAQVTVVAAAVVVAARADAWPTLGRFFTTLTAAGLTGLLAALAIVLLTGGYATMRRVTV
jgi:hypothetical protein